MAKFELKFKQCGTHSFEILTYFFNTIFIVNCKAVLDLKLN